MTANHRGVCIFSSAVFGLLLTFASCADDVERIDDDGSVTTGVTGVTSTGAGHNGPSTGAWGSGSTGVGGGDVGGPDEPYPIVFAHGFFGFEEFAGQNFATYFYGVKAALAAEGEVAFTPAVDPFNDSTYRGAQLAVHIEAILAETGRKKVVIIGHSQGGLDARVVAHDRPDLVAAVITVATPHRGTPVADVVLQLISDPNFEEVLDDMVSLIGAPLYDQVGDETAVSKPMHLFSQEGIAAFNASYPDDPSVFYASIAGRTAYHQGGQDCVPEVDVPFLSMFDDDLDPTEPLFYLSEAIADGNGSVPNDGLVRVADAKHGEFWGCIPADHMDEVGHLFGDSPGLGNPFDHRLFYRGLVARVRALGY